MYSTNIINYIWINKNIYMYKISTGLNGNYLKSGSHAKSSSKDMTVKAKVRWRSQYYLRAPNIVLFEHVTDIYYNKIEHMWADNVL